MGGIEEKDTALSHDANSHKSKLLHPSKSEKRLLSIHSESVGAKRLLCLSHTQTHMGQWLS